VLQWPFGSQEAAAVEQPVVLAVGGASPPPVHKVVDRLASWLPHSQRVTIDGADHLLPLRDPAPLARMITGAQSSIA
jgi:pimeloyl-ACP methyl ester carboxylesterase